MMRERNGENQNAEGEKMKIKKPALKYSYHIRNSKTNHNFFTH